MVPRPTRRPLTQNRYLRRAYREQSLFASKRVRWALLLAAAVLYVAQFVGGDRGLLHRLAMEEELGKTRVMNASLVQERASLIRELNLQENDPLSLEKLAREKAWLANENELIYRFEDDELVPELGPEFGVVEPTTDPEPQESSNSAS